MSQINLKSVKRTFKQGGETITACDNVDLSVDKGELSLIIGPSGSGKSTLLQLIGGLDSPDSGSVRVADNDVSSLRDTKLTVFRRKNIGFVFQNFNLIPTLTATQNVEAAIYPRSKSDKSKVEKVLHKVDLSARADHLPSKLSGGEQQRVAIARAIINDHKIILADEPTGNLDSKNGRLVMELLSKLCKEEGKTIIAITHSEYGFKYADTVYKMLDGKLTKRK